MLMVLDWPMSILTHAHIKILTSMGGLKKARGLTKQEIVIQVNPNKPTNYTIVWAWVVVTHVTSYDVLIGGVVLYPLWVAIDFGRKPHTTIQVGIHELITRLHSHWDSSKGKHQNLTSQLC